MKNFLKENKAILAIILIAVFFILAGASQASDIKLNLKGTESKTGEITYLPAVYFDKGSYWFYLTAEGTGETEFCLFSSEYGEIFKSTIKGGESKYYDISLEHNMTNVKIVTQPGEVVLKKVTFSSYGIFYTDTYFVALFVLALGVLAICLKNMKDRQKRGILIFLIASAMISSYLLFNSKLYYGHDIYFHLFRIEGIKEGLLSGQFPVRLHPVHNSGYGYITPCVYPELFLYFPAILRLLGTSVDFAYKAFVFAINLTTAFIMYYSTKTITKSRYASLLASIIYTLSTWRLMNVFARAAVGEMLALTFMPLAIAGIYQIICGDRKKWYVLAIACTLIFQSHIISTVICAILCVIFALCFFVKIFKEKRWLEIIKAGTLTLLLNLWFLVPFVKYYFGTPMQISRELSKKVPFFENAVSVSELFNVFNHWNGWALSLGFAVSVLLVILIADYFFKKDSFLKKEKFKHITFYIILVFIFCATTLFPWERLQNFEIINKFGHIVQFPWRFLSMASVLIVILSAEFLKKHIVPEKKAVALLCIFVVCSLFTLRFGAEFTRVETIASKPGYAACDDKSTIGYDKEYLLVGTRSENLKLGRYVSYNTRVLYYEKDRTDITFTAYGKGKGRYVELPLLYYPGYRAVLNGKEELLVACGANNVIRVNMGEKSGMVEVFYEGFWYFRLAEIMSLITFLAFVVAMIKNKKHKMMALQGDKNE